MTLVVDHVVVCVEDLDEAAARFEEEHGVVTVEGGRHVGQGTENRLIPLGDSYIELLAVVDRATAENSVLGSWALQRAGRAGADGLCLRTEDLDAVCTRLGLEASAMSRVTPAGSELRWRLAGLDLAATRGLPFFIQWDIPMELHPGRAEVVHPAGEVRLAGVTMSGDPDTLDRWLIGSTRVAMRAGSQQVTFRLDATV